MPDYSFIEKADMVYIYGAAGGNASQESLYWEWSQDRQVLDT
jgi:hypothetical protein